MRKNFLLSPNKLCARSLSCKCLFLYRPSNCIKSILTHWTLALNSSEDLTLVDESNKYFMSSQKPLQHVILSQISQGIKHKKE